MKCEICRENEAVIHIQQVIGKERIDLHLCETCALERGIASHEDKIELSISNLLNGLIDIRQEKQGGKKTCPQCESTWEAIIKREKMGCAECYSNFNREIRALFGKTVGKSQHQGKYPRRLLSYKTFLLDVVKLKEGLKEAIQKEDYERAALLRDQIHTLEKFPGEQ